MNNSHNRFNMNVFLNETCKDAMNLDDFVNSIEVNLEDFEYCANGFPASVSRVFLRGLKKLKMTERPIHCSDVKREIFYVKNNNEWHLDEDNKIIPIFNLNKSCKRTRLDTHCNRIL